MMEYLDHLQTQEQTLFAEQSLIEAALYAAHERQMEIQRGERLRALSRATGRPETREEAIREMALVLRHLEEEKMWIETQLDDLGMRRSIWQTLLSEKSAA
jgi:hypothetical protein